jgi:hypothetical protein
MIIYFENKCLNYAGTAIGFKELFTTGIKIHDSNLYIHFSVDWTFPGAF